jgi:hypothetical protein
VTLTLLLVVSDSLLLQKIEGFTTSCRSNNRRLSTVRQYRFASGFATSALFMGLYDKPLPPRPPPRAEPNKKKNVEDEDVEDFQEAAVSESLFQFEMNGKERRNLLPPLKRRLDSGVECYFEPTDRLVQNLVGKTSVSVEDACWALEACQGDITEAWLCISTARRMLLDQSRMTQIVEEDDNEFDPDDYEIELQEDFEMRKSSSEAQELKRRTDILKKPSQPNNRWLPTENPKAVDDEPWFTTGYIH